jgi:2'-5' RNA ligase
MRLFYAADFAAHVKEALAENLTAVKKHISRASFTDRDNFHITIVFIGECGFDMLENLKKAADNAVSGLNASPVSGVMDSLGTFGRPGDEILWAGVRTEPENILQKINRAVRDELELCGIKLKDGHKRFTPHVTLARRAEFRDISGKDLKQIKFTPIEFTVNSITLMESVRYNKLIYRPVYERKF